MDETFVRVGGKQMYLFRGVHSRLHCIYLRLGTANRPNASNPDTWPPHLFARDVLRSYRAVIRELKPEGKIRLTCRERTRDTRKTVWDPIIGM